jgi:hypothetical protein
MQIFISFQYVINNRLENNLEGWRQVRGTYTHHIRPLSAVPCQQFPESTLSAVFYLQPLSKVPCLQSSTCNPTV